MKKDDELKQRLERDLPDLHGYVGSNFWQGYKAAQEISRQLTASGIDYMPRGELNIRLKEQVHKSTWWNSDDPTGSMFSLMEVVASILQTDPAVISTLGVQEIHD